MTTAYRNPNPNPNPNPSVPLIPRPLTLTLLLALILPAALSSPVPSPSPASTPPKYPMSDPTGNRPSPPEKSLHYPPPRPPCPAGHLDCHRRRRHRSAVPPARHERRLNFGQLMGIVLAGITVALQVALGAFLVYKRLQLTKAERRGTALVDIYARCGQIEEASLVFKLMEEKDLQSWTIMISGFSFHGRGEEAISLFSQMEMIGLKPDSMSFSGILSACSHLGLVDEGKKFFSKMVNVYNIEPTMEHCGCMVDLCGREGLSEAASDFIRELPVTPNEVVLQSFLEACRNFNVIPGMDAKLVELLLKEESHFGSNYVIATNVTALSGRWDD